MKLIAPTDTDALLIIGVLLKRHRHMVVDRKWNGIGGATKASYISVDCDSDEAPALAADFASVDANFSLEEV